MGLGVTSRMLTQKTHLVLAILLHFIQLILNDDCLVNQMSKVWVASVEQLELGIVLETLEKCVLLLVIGVDIISCVPGQLNELIQVFIHRHIPLIQF
jgi:hypothetical protein